MPTAGRVRVRGRTLSLLGCLANRLPRFYPQPPFAIGFDQVATNKKIAVIETPNFANWRGGVDRLTHHYEADGAVPKHLYMVQPLLPAKIMCLVRKEVMSCQPHVPGTIAFDLFVLPYAQEYGPVTLPH